MSPPSPGVRSKPSIAYCLIHAGFLLRLLFNPEDGGDMFLPKGSCFEWIALLYISEDRILLLKLYSKNLYNTEFMFLL
jgi:hypothetical protein